jgi:hypothetical protein
VYKGMCIPLGITRRKVREPYCDTTMFDNVYRLERGSLQQAAN